MEKSEPRVAVDVLKRKREREQEIVSQMIALYCKGNHSAHRSVSLRERGGEMRQMREGAALRERGSGERWDLCPECAELEAYAHARSERCPFMEEKTFCSNCTVHCYRPEMRERIRTVMRYAGPRMLFHHPVMAIRHMIESQHERRRVRSSR
ncbi:nitrous oxide-stimulated promoter family protein [Collinsella intestinalis]|uniref:nitrous oxide-stimulated promoter family protein n=1 Tax=Collinsella intestinalis TaxID=147207 RepID=UPI00241CB9A3|nr:nitrous oxide-stimulated promoter family protein [Collinsella intestinalis]